MFSWQEKDMEQIVWCLLVSEYVELLTVFQLFSDQQQW